MKSEVPVDKIIRNIVSKGVEYADEIQKWWDESGENKDTYQDIFNIWQVTETFPERFSPDRNKAWQNVRQKINFKKRKYILYRRIAQIAAAVIIILLSIWMGTRFDNWEQATYSEIISPPGQKTRIILPDSSIILLNSDSRIRYSQNFTKHDRNIYLDGEGFFDVRRDLTREFIVSTSSLKIKVFGTSFNVKSYDNDQTIEVGLKNGRIAIDHYQKEIVQLDPGQVATFNKNKNELKVDRMDKDLISAWTRNEMVFEEDTMDEIVKYLERWYDVEIKISPELLNGDLFTFKVKTESLRELLDLINLLRPIKYQIEGKRVFITKP